MSVRKLIERSIAAREEMDHALHEAADLPGPDERRQVARPHVAWTPMVDVTEDERGFHICVDLPGVEEQDVVVEVSGSRLTIAGTRRQTAERQGKRTFFQERSFGDFERKILLPFEADEERVVASFRLGVLTVALFKAATQESMAGPRRA